MLQFYTHAKRLALFSAIFLSLTAGAQNATSVTRGLNCDNIVADFDNGDSRFSSPSVYSSSVRDSAFYYNRRRGYWSEVGNDGAERTIPPALSPAADRLISIVSPAYTSPSLAGVFDVAFTYVVPNPAVDQFVVRLVRLTTNGGVTTPDIIADSRFLTFNAFTAEAPTEYTDPFGNPVLTGFRGRACVRLSDPDIVVGPNINYRVEVTYVVRTPGTFTVFDDLAVGDVTPIPLPVNFVGLFARRNSNDVEVRWDVAQEVNVKEYIIERSFTGTGFTAIGTVRAGTKSYYKFTDASADNRTVFYRIRNVDNDGRSKQSSIVKISGNSATSFSNTLKLYPLPAGNMVTIEHPALPVGSEITIRTVEGQVLRRFQPRASVSHTPLDLTGIVSGMYLIHINTGSGDGQTLKLIKR